MCRLHDEGRDHIWGYYVRNLARPLWLSREKNRVDVLVGNPPWLAYRHMTPDMQEAFKSMTEQRGLWAGAEVATHQDLSALFVVRACELYLRVGGKFGFVMPNAALDRSHYDGFRSGHYGGKSGIVDVAFDEPWDLRRLRPHFFPRASGVVFGTRMETDAATKSSNAEIWAGRKMPEEAEIWTGRVESLNASWPEAKAWFERKRGKVRRVGQTGKSPYAPYFTQGATFTPRFLFVVERREVGALGVSSGRVAIKSSRSVQEKTPWKTLTDMTGVVETEFVRPFYTGENVFPFRPGEPQLALVPCGKAGLLNRTQIEMNPGLDAWWSKSQELWEANRSSDRLSLSDRLDYQSTLTKQFPVASLRVVYNRAGMHLAAAKITDRRALIANGLYWATVGSIEEADYLCAIINAPAMTELVRPFMSYGKDERDIHKHVWEIPIPLYNAEDNVHRRLASLGKSLEAVAAKFELNSELHFAASRRHMREVFEKTSEGKEVNDIVFEMFG